MVLEGRLEACNEVMSVQIVFLLGVYPPERSANVGTALERAELWSRRLITHEPVKVTKSVQISRLKDKPLFADVS